MNVTVEVLLVIECIRSGESVSRTARIRKYIESGVSWMALIQYAIVHGVLPLVADSLKATSADLLPSDVLFQFNRALKRAEARNQAQWAAIESIMEVFRNEGVRLLAFKGAALTSLAYGDLRLRESYDVDLWAAAEDTARAGEILRSIGYAPVSYKDGISVPTESMSRAHGEFRGPNDEIAIDLQNILPQFYFKPDFNELWEQRSLVDGPVVSVPTLSKENYLLSLAVHGEKHAWRRINWIVDVDRLLRASTDLDWASLSDRAIRWRCHRRLYSTLAIQSRLCASPIAHDEVVGYLTHWTTERVLDRLLRVDVGNVPPRTMKVAAQSFSSHYVLTDRSLDRANLLFTKLTEKLSTLTIKTEPA